jgi:tetratricopeptide (TPR) repeat protein
MTRPSLLLPALFCLALAAPVGAKDAPWVRLRSPNYLFVGNAESADVRAVAERFEQFRALFAAQFPAAGATSQTPTVVVIFKDNEDYRRFRPLYGNTPVDFDGYFQSGLDVNYVVLPAGRGLQDAYAKIFHESVHLLIESRARSVPDWFNEGLALYYSTLEMSDADNKVVIGRPVDEYVRTLRARPLLPLAALTAIDRASADYNEADKSGLFYAESWALVHYLISGHGGARQLQILRFLELYAAGIAEPDAFRKAFGVGYEEMEQELGDYVARDITGIKYMAAGASANLAALPQPAPLDEAEAHYYQGDLLLHIDRLDDAIKQLKLSVAADEHNATAHAALGVAYARQQKFAEAERELQRAVALAPANHLTHYYYAYGLSRRGMDATQTVTNYDAAAARVMRAELNRAIALAPDFPESYRLLAFVNLVTGEQLDESVALLKRALTLAPGRPDIAFVLAETYVRRGEPAEARETLRLILRSSANPRLRARANALLQHLAAGR